MHQDTKRLLKHIFHLTFLKGFSRFIPLLTVPLLMRTIGLEQLGMIKWIEAMADYFLVFIGYGFRYTATQQINTHQHDQSTIEQIIGAVYSLKLVAILVCGLISWVMLYWVPQLQAFKAYWWTYYAVIVISMLYPCFIWQGLNQMHWMTGINLFTKLLFVGFIALGLRDPEDSWLYHIYLAAVYLVRLVLAWVVVYYKMQLRMRWPQWHQISFQLKAGWHVFISQLVASFYLRLPAVSLGFLMDPLHVGIYVIGSKIVELLMSMLEPVMQALYPIACQKWTTSIQAGYAFMRRMLWMGCIALVCMGLFYAIYAHFIVLLLAGQPMPDAAQVLRLYAFLPCMSFVIHAIGIGLLLPLKGANKYTLTIVLAGLLCAGLLMLLVPSFQLQGAAWAMLLSHGFAVGAMVIWAHRQIKIFNKQPLNIQLKAVD